MTRGNQDWALPEPGHAPDVTLSAVLAGRRSVRELADVELDRSDIGELLWAAQGITGSNGLRAAPSAGALYPLTGARCDRRGPVPVPARWSPPGAHIRFGPPDAARRGCVEPGVGRARTGGVRDQCRRFSLTARRYGGRAERHVYLEAGHAAQNLLLQAVALGLGGVPVGAFDDDAVHELLRLPGTHRPVYLLPLGRPSATPNH